MMNKNWDKAKTLARLAGNTYLKHRERIDSAFIGHATTSAILHTAAGKVAVSALAVKLAPIAAAAAGAYYGPEICKRARDFLAETDIRQPRLLLAPVRIQKSDAYNLLKPR